MQTADSRLVVIINIVAGHGEYFGPETTTLMSFLASTHVTYSISVALQAVTVISMGGIADHRLSDSISWLELMQLLTSAFINAAVTSLFLFVAPS